LFINKTFCLFTGWLDDIGLPQYKDYFYDARIDGRMLHFLTIVSLDVEGKNMQKTLLHYLRKSSIYLFLVTAAILNEINFKRGTPQPNLA
jgi:hypothetical protein